MGLCKALPRWMLQICVVDLWRHCRCGYFHFYDATMLMKRAMEKSRKPLESVEAFSLAAACVLVSFTRLHETTEGRFALQNVLVNRLQRGDLDKLHPKVTFESITRALEGMDEQAVSEWLNVDRPGQHSDDRTNEGLFLDMLDYIAGNANVIPPAVPTSHFDCMSQDLRRADNAISMERLVEWSEEIVMRVLENNSTVEDQQIWRSTQMPNPVGSRLRLKSNALRTMRYHLKEAITLRKLHKLLPQNLNLKDVRFRCAPNGNAHLQKMCNNVKQALTFRELNKFLLEIQCSL